MACPAALDFICGRESPLQLLDLKFPLILDLSFWYRLADYAAAIYGWRYETAAFGQARRWAAGRCILLSLGLLGASRSVTQ